MGRRPKSPPPSCRFCLESKTTTQNYLFAPCACKGSVEYVHYACFLRWFFTCTPQTRMTCPICKTIYTKTPLDTLDPIPREAPSAIGIVGSPVTSILVTHYIFPFLFPVLQSVHIPVAPTYAVCIFLYQAIFFSLLAHTVSIRKPFLYARAYWTRKSWALPLCHGMVLGFLAYDPAVFFIAGVCANGLLTFYWPAHIDALRESNMLAMEDLALEVTLMDD